MLQYWLKLFVGDGLQGTVFVTLQMACATPIELSYYSTTNVISRKDICCHCASSDDVERDAAHLQKYRVVLPMCGACKQEGKQVIARLPKKN